MLKGKIDGTKIPNKPKKAETVKKEELADAKAQQIITSTVSKKCLMDLLSLKISWEMFQKLSSISEWDTE